MKKSELKSAFDKEFKNIEVSEELKAKTLKTISEAQTPKTLLRYLLFLYYAFQYI